MTIIFFGLALLGLSISIVLHSIELRDLRRRINSDEDIIDSHSRLLALTFIKVDNIEKQQKNNEKRLHCSPKG